MPKRGAHTNGDNNMRSMYVYIGCPPAVEVFAVTERAETAKDTAERYTDAKCKADDTEMYYGYAKLRAQHIG